MSDVEDFVLDFCRATGGVVEPPAYGIYDVLLPDEVAAQLGVLPLQRFAFGDRAASAEPTGELPAGQDVTWLTYGHPLVEAMVEAARARPACARYYVGEVRLDKRGLLGLARSALTFPNATLNEIPRALETPTLFRSVRFNFKAALISDEKRETLVSTLMDAQTGGVMSEPPTSETYRLTDRPVYTHLPLAPTLWSDAPDPLAPEPMRGLLERASRAAVESLAAPIAALEARTARHLELDRARLDEYYDGLERDLERRLARAEDDARRRSLEEKLAAARADRAAKLADVQAKYHLRAELDLINVAIIHQPKIALQVRIENRHAAVTRLAVWDPVRHVIEPLMCDVCHRPSASLTLCANNHLAHADCLAPQCLDCKRAYCRNCADQLTTCVVCERPVCQKSLTRCRECSRGTCREHAGLCHAADGAPAKIAPTPIAPTVEAAPPPPPPAAPPRAEQPAEHGHKRKSLAAASREKKPRSAATRLVKLPDASRGASEYDWGYRLEVQLESSEPLVAAFVLAKGGREIAQRIWRLTDDGIAVTCHCEKGVACPADGLLLKPEHAAGIDEQIDSEIAALRSEYHIPVGRMTVRAILHSNLTRLPKLRLRGQWKDDGFLGGVRARFLAEQLREHPEDFTPLKFPDWALAFDRAEREAYVPDIDRFIQVAAGWLFYEGALPTDELAELTASVAHPGAWYSPERARDVFRTDPRFSHVRGSVVSLPEVEHPLIVLKEKAARRLPPRAFTAEELIAAGSGPLPLSAREIEIENALNRHAPKKVYLRSLQRIFRNTDAPGQVMTTLINQLQPRDMNEANRLLALLNEIWNHTSRYELRGHTPSQVHAFPQPAS